ncbi:unnamed protein product [Soboliphyme baturini]|uniref:PilX_N domain-containing protein n=1 Tax=Soboliphyme baturini TaxID=241478 RepID=A0A183J198_9BILA|nr:unnamed protein product [Soboliphyme baturini]
MINVHRGEQKRPGGYNLYVNRTLPAKGVADFKRGNDAGADKVASKLNVKLPQKAAYESVTRFTLTLTILVASRALKPTQEIAQVAQESCRQAETMAATAMDMGNRCRIDSIRVRDETSLSSASAAGALSAWAPSTQQQRTWS